MTFETDLLRNLSASLAVPYHLLAEDYAATKTASDIAWEREKTAAYRAYFAEVGAFKRRWEGAVNRMVGAWCADMALDAMGLPQSLRP